MNKRGAEMIVHFLIKTKVNFNFTVKGEHHRIVIPHGQSVKEILNNLMNDDPMATPINVTTDAQGLILS